MFGNINNTLRFFYNSTKVKRGHGTFVGKLESPEKCNEIVICVCVCVGGVFVGEPCSEASELLTRA
jgi:hypothetical protein